MEPPSVEPVGQDGGDLLSDLDHPGDDDLVGLLDLPTVETAGAVLSPGGTLSESAAVTLCDVPRIVHGSVGLRPDLDPDGRGGHGRLPVVAGEGDGLPEHDAVTPALEDRPGTDVLFGAVRLDLEHPVEGVVAEPGGGPGQVVDILDGTGRGKLGVLAAVLVVDVEHAGSFLDAPTTPTIQNLNRGNLVPGESRILQGTDHFDVLLHPGKLFFKVGCTWPI